MLACGAKYWKNVHVCVDALLLLQGLTKQNQEIQKVIVFNGVYQKIFEIIAGEVRHFYSNCTMKESDWVGW